METTAVVIEDDPAIRRVVKHALAGEVNRVLESVTAADGIDLVASARPAIVVLDLGLPDSTGLDVCREIRHWSSVPIVVLSARQSDQEKITLLDAGADDYLTKPFNTAEFVARVRAILRRTSRTTEGDQKIVFGQFVMDLRARRITRDGIDVHLTPTEWELLRVLATAPDRALTHQHLFNAVWSPRNSGDAQQYLRVHIANLRRKIEDDLLNPRFIVTEPGVGYRFAGSR